MQQFDRLLVGVDVDDDGITEGSRVAARQALQLAKHVGATVDFLNAAWGMGDVTDDPGRLSARDQVAADHDQAPLLAHQHVGGLEVVVHDAELVGRDTKIDIAVLRVETDDPLPTLNWGDSDRLRVGDALAGTGSRPVALSAGSVAARKGAVVSGRTSESRRQQVIVL